MRRDSLSQFKSTAQFLVLIVLLVSCSKAKKEESKVVKIMHPLDVLMTDFIDNKELIGAEISIRQHSEIIFHKAYGWKSLEQKNQIQKNDIWAVKSMTKPVTATAILMLAEEGLLSLDDPLTKYLPEYAGFEQATIRNLLLQNSGDDGSHGNGGFNIYDFNTQQDWVMDWAAEKAKGTFGQYYYSNFNYEALGYIIAKVSGQPVEDFIKERIIMPLGLKNTYTHFSPQMNWAENVPNRYKKNGKNEIELMQANSDPQPWKFFPASLGLWMSNKDFSTFMQMWMNGGQHLGEQILQENTIKEALQIGVWISEEDQAGQGLGWLIENDPFIYYKGGNDGSIGIAYPEEDIIIVFNTHLQGGNGTEKLMNFLGEHLFGWE